jgi:hypothetical protein
MSLSKKKLICKGTLRQVFLSEALSTPITLSIPPLHIGYVYTVHVYMYPYSILIHTVKGGGGRERWTREKVRGGKLGRKYQHVWLHLQSINSDKHLPQSPLIGRFFRWQHLALLSIKLNIVNKSMVSLLQSQSPEYCTVYTLLRYSNMVKAPNFDRVFMKNIFYSIFLLGDPLWKKSTKCVNQGLCSAKVKVFILSFIELQRKISWGCLSYHLGF